MKRVAKLDKVHWQMKSRRLLCGTVAPYPLVTDSLTKVTCKICVRLIGHEEHLEDKHV